MLAAGARFLQQLDIDLLQTSCKGISTNHHDVGVQQRRAEQRLPQDSNVPDLLFAWAVGHHLYRHLR